MVVRVAGLRVAGYGDPFRRRRARGYVQQGALPRPRWPSRTCSPSGWPGWRTRSTSSWSTSPRWPRRAIEALRRDPPSHPIVLLVGHTHHADIELDRDFTVLNGGTVGAGGTGNLGEGSKIGVARMTYATGGGLRAAGRRPRRDRPGQRIGDREALPARRAARRSRLANSVNRPSRRRVEPCEDAVTGWLRCPCGVAVLPLDWPRHDRTVSAADAAPLRLAVIDTDSGFLQVLTKRLERLAWEHRVLASAVPVDTVVAMRLNAIVVDLAVLGPPAWEYLEKLCAALPGLGVRRVHGPVDGGPARARPAPGGRRLADQAVPSRGAHRPGRGRRAPPPARRGALVGRARSPPARSRSAPIASRPSCARSSIDLTRREFELIELLAGAEGRVLEREEIYQRVWGYAMARGDRSVDVFVRKLRQKLEKASPGWRYIHTHFGVGYRFAPEPGGRRGHRARAGRAGRWPPSGAAGAWRRRPSAPRCSELPRSATSRSSSSLAAAVAFLPAGARRRALIGAILSTLIIVSLVFFAYRFYREHRVELDGLGDRWRGLLYGAIGVVVLALAALPRLSDTLGRHARRGRAARRRRRTRSTPSGATTASTPEPRIPAPIRDGRAVSRDGVPATLPGCARALQTRAGQVELVALLPLVVLVGALLWQAVVAGQALWLSGAAARAAARAAAVGGDAAAAAERRCRRVWRRGAARGRGRRGRSASRVAVPSVRRRRLARHGARARPSGPAAMRRATRRPRAGERRARRAAAAGGARRAGDRPAARGRRRRASWRATPPRRGAAALLQGGDPAAAARAALPGWSRERADGARGGAARRRPRAPARRRPVLAERLEASALGRRRSAMSPLRDLLVAPRTGRRRRSTTAGAAAASARRASAGRRGRASGLARCAGAGARAAGGGGRRRPGARAGGARGARVRALLGARLRAGPARARARRGRAPGRVAARPRPRGVGARAARRSSRLPDDRAERRGRRGARAGRGGRAADACSRSPPATTEVDVLLGARDAILVALPADGRAGAGARSRWPEPPRSSRARRRSRSGSIPSSGRWRWPGVRAPGAIRRRRGRAAAVSRRRSAARGSPARRRMVLLGLLVAVVLGAVVLGGIARGVGVRGELQSAADLSALAAARAMHDAYPRVFEPPVARRRREPAPPRARRVPGARRARGARDRRAQRRPRRARRLPRRRRWRRSACA